jgi:hypothetical protein
VAERAALTGEAVDECAGLQFLHPLVDERRYAGVAATAVHGWALGFTARDYRDELRAADQSHAEAANGDGRVRP